MAEIATISTKGQVVIPSHIRQELGLKEGSQLVVSRMEDLILLKKVNIPDPKEEFNRLTRIGQAHAKKAGIKSEDDVARIIHGARKAKIGSYSRHNEEGWSKLLHGEKCLSEKEAEYMRKAAADIRKEKWFKE